MLATTAPPRNVLLVDDDPWTRGGVLAALGASPGFTVAVRSVAEALEHPVAPAPDGLVIDVRDRTAPPDRYRGVRVVEHVRAAEPEPGRCRVVVMAAAPIDPVLQVRAAEAGADEVRSWEHTDEAGLRSSLAGERGGPPMAVSSLKRSLGLDPAGSVNAFVAELDADGLLDAFAPGTTQQGSGLARRRSMALRRRALEVAGLLPSTDAGHQALAMPSWREVRALVNAARGVSATEGA